MFKAMLASTAMVGAMLITGAAFAVPVAGSSGGSFSNLSSCDNSGSDQNCRIVGTGNGPNTQVQWGSTSSHTNFRNPSTLTAVDVNINTNTNANDVVIARLDWFNSATLASQTDDHFGVNWTLSVSFTQPNVSSDSEVFNLSITNPTNPPGDTISNLTLADLAGLTFTLNGVVVSDLKYKVVDGAGGNGFNDTSFLNGAWYNAENNWASLYITADFTGTRVPEPTSLALFGAGLAGLGLLGRRRTTR